jgi:hypothetical protein
MMSHPIVDWRRLFNYFAFGTGLAFDAGFTAPPVILFRRARVRPSDQVLCRFENVRNLAIARSEIQLELEAKKALLSSKSLNLKEFYRNVRFRVKYTIGQALRKLNLI